MTGRGHRPVWVVGAGFLGSVLAASCRSAGDEVVTIDAVAPADVTGDASDGVLLRRTAGRLDPHVVFVCTATGGGEEGDYRHAYLDVLRAVSWAVPRAKAVFCSSTSVYGEKDGRLVDEASPCFGDGARARLLLQAEEAALRGGGVVARLCPLYGAGRFELLRRYLAGEPKLPGADDRLLNYVHVEDAAGALRLLASKRGVFNVCGATLTKGEAYALLEKTFGVPPSAESSTNGKRGCCHQRVSAEKLRSLGWIPRPLVFRREGRKGFGGESD